MEQLVANGEVVRGYLGVSVQDVTADLAAGFDLKDKGGALIADVLAGSPADKSGLEPGDVVTEINGRSINDSRRLKLTVAGIAPGSTVPATVLRDGETEKIELQVGNQPSDRRVAGASRNRSSRSTVEEEGALNGVAVADLDPRARREFDIPSRLRGALITEVAPDSAAAKAGLQPGEVITEINREPVASAEDAIKLTEETSSKKTLVRVWNPRGIRYVVVDETEAASN
jgi:serine protease Do